MKIENYSSKDFILVRLSSLFCRNEYRYLSNSCFLSDPYRFFNSTIIKQV